MPFVEPVVLIVTTQTWPQVTRLALRFSSYGCRVNALCPARSELRSFDGLDGYYRLRSSDPLRSLKAAIKSSHPTHLLPGDDRAVWLLHELWEGSPQYRVLIERSLGSSDCFATLRSRSRLLSLASRLGILVPETAGVSRVEDVREWSRGRELPFLLKVDGTWGGGGVEVVSERSALEGRFAKLSAKLSPVRRARRRHSGAAAPSRVRRPEISVQAYVEGVAANAMFACDRGRILGAAQVRVIASKGKTGAAVMIDLYEDARIKRAGQLLAASLGLSGFFGLDFVLEQGTGAPYLIEMNPRCTQLGHIALPGQPDLAGLLWAEWSGQAAPAVGDPELGGSICFYPQALDLGSGSRFLEKARFDVQGPDRVMVDRLAKGSQALFARSYRAARRHAGLLKRTLAPPEREWLFYVDAQMQPCETNEEAPPASARGKRPLAMPLARTELAGGLFGEES